MHTISFLQCQQLLPDVGHVWLPVVLQAADATCSLAAVWLAIGPSHGQEAAQQLRSVLPTVLGNGDMALQARAQLLLAKALLAEATPADLKADFAG